MTPSSLPHDLKWDISVMRYRLWLKFFSPEIILKTGKYNAQGMTIKEFLTDWTKNPLHSDNTITVLPWWNIYDMDAYFTRENVLASGAFLETLESHLPLYQEKYSFLQWVKSLEWFLMPDTYRVSKSADADEIITVMLREFQKKIAPSYETLWNNAYDSLILASIIEREEKSSANKSTVAGILAKRLKEGIPLWADATVCYSFRLMQSECTPRFIGENIAWTSEYNTRNQKWLPPTPISSISLWTWNATINPTDSPYYFYLHDSAGAIHYATTHEEHIRNKNMYLR